jgi:hypothetical protein
VLKWNNTCAGYTASNVMAFGVVPVGMVGGLDAAGPGGQQFLNDLLIVAESTAIAGALKQLVKFIVGRERPFAHALSPEEKLRTDQPSDNNTSFYSGRSLYTMALGTSAATVATIGGCKSAPLLGAGIAEGVLTGSFRLAGNRHYTTDVLTRLGWERSSASVSLLCSTAQLQCRARTRRRRSWQRARMASPFRVPGNQASERTPNEYDRAGSRAGDSGLQRQPDRRGGRSSR